MRRFEPPSALDGWRRAAARCRGANRTCARWGHRWGSDPLPELDSRLSWGSDAGGEVRAPWTRQVGVDRFRGGAKRSVELEGLLALRHQPPTRRVFSIWMLSLQAQHSPSSSGRRRETDERRNSHRPRRAGTTPCRRSSNLRRPAAGCAGTRTRA